MTLPSDMKTLESAGEAVRVWVWVWVWESGE